jgi:hypothetical protein
MQSIMCNDLSPYQHLAMRAVRNRAIGLRSTAVVGGMLDAAILEYHTPEN